MSLPLPASIKRPYILREGQVLVRLSPLRDRCWWAQSCTPAAQIPKATVSLRVQQPGRWHSTASLSFRSLLLSLCPFLVLPEPSRGDMDVPFRPEHSTASSSQHCDQLKVSAVTTACCKWKFLWPKLRAVLIFGDKHSCLEGSLMGTSHLFSSTFTIKAYDVRSLRLLTRFTVLNSNFHQLPWPSE